MGANFQHITGGTGGVALAIVCDEGASPLDAVPAKLSLLAIFQHQGRPLVIQLGDHGRHQRFISGLLGQMGHYLLVIPIDFACFPQQCCHATVTVTSVIVEHPIQQGLTGGALALGTDSGIDVQAHGVGIFTELLHHLLAHHLPQIGSIEGDLGTVITGLDGHLGRLVILGLGDLAGFQHTTQHHVAAGKGTFR